MKDNTNINVDSLKVCRVPGSPQFLPGCRQRAAEAAPTSPLCRKWWQIACYLHWLSRWWAWRWRLLAAPPPGEGLQKAHWQSTWNRGRTHYYHHHHHHQESGRNFWFMYHSYWYNSKWRTKASLLLKHLFVLEQRLSSSLSMAKNDTWLIHSFIFSILWKLADIPCACSCTLGSRRLECKHRETKSISILKLQLHFSHSREK